MAAHSFEPGQPEEGIELILLAGEKMTLEKKKDDDLRKPKINMY